MIEAETKGKQALLDAIIECVDPHEYDGDSPTWCLIGQTALKTLTDFQRAESHYNDCWALAHYFRVDVDLVRSIYDGVSAPHLANNYQASLEYARRVLANGAA